MDSDADPIYVPETESDSSSAHHEDDTDLENVVPPTDAESDDSDSLVKSPATAEVSDSLVKSPATAEARTSCSVFSTGMCEYIFIVSNVAENQ